MGLCHCWYGSPKQQHQMTSGCHVCNSSAGLLTRYQDGTRFNPLLPRLDLVFRVLVSPEKLLDVVGPGSLQKCHDLLMSTIRFAKGCLVPGWLGND